MKVQDTGAGPKGDLGLADAVARHLLPLLTSHGFVRGESARHSFEFRSHSVSLALLFDPYSYELAIDVFLRAEPSRRYGLLDILEAALGPHSKEESFFQASNPERVDFCLRAMADLLGKYGNAVLTGNPAAFEQMQDAARRRNNAYAQDTIHKRVRMDAEGAWRCRDYAKIIEIYGALEAELTPLERKKLNYAKSHTAKPGIA